MAQSWQIIRQDESTLSDGTRVRQTLEELVEDLPPPVPAPIIQSFTASQTTIVQGQSVTLTWHITGTVELVTVNGQQATSPHTVAPDIDTIYTLRAYGPDKEAVPASLTITVNPVNPPPPDPPPVTEGVLLDGKLTCRALVVGDETGEHGPHFEHNHKGRVIPEPTKRMARPGPASDPLTWSPNGVPGPSDVCFIPALDDDPTKDTEVEAPIFLTNKNGRTKILKLDPTKRFTHTIPDLPLDPALDPDQWGNVFGNVGGTLEIRGAPKKAHIDLAGEAHAGDTRFTFAEVPFGWRIGDRVAIGDTRQKYWQIAEGNSGGDHKRFHEERALTAVGSDHVEFSPPLVYDHLGARDKDGGLTFRPTVVNLSSNVVVRSANKDGHRGHTVSHGRALTIEHNVEYRNLGRTTNAPWDNTTYDVQGNVTRHGTNQKGRYPNHRHHGTGPVRTQAERDDPNVYQGETVNCVAWNEDTLDPAKLPRGGIVIHNTSDCLYMGNAVYNVSGAGIVGEDGSECRNRIKGNFVLRVAYSDEGENNRGGLDAWFTSACYWLRGVDNYFTDNKGTQANKGVVIWPYVGAVVRRPLWKGADPSVEGEYEIVNNRDIPLRLFENNVLGGMMGTAYEPWQLGDSRQPNRPGSVMRNCGAWHCVQAMYLYTAHNLTIDGLVARNDQAYFSVGLGDDLAIYSSDYETPGLVIKNANIQGFGTAWIPAPIGNSEMRDSFLHCYDGVEVRPIFQQGMSAETQPPRDVTLRNVTYSPVIDRDLDPQWYWGKRSFVKMFHTISKPTNLVALNRVFVYAANGAPADNFRAYFNEAARIALCPQTETGGGRVLINGCPVAGLTNEEALAQHGVCYAGELPPLDVATRDDVVGLVSPLPSGG